jgi:hypothetical protein
VRTYVWVEAWQQQCCGADFGVGSGVRWKVTPVEGRDGWVTTLLGPGWGDAVQYTEDHHGIGDAARSLELAGVVRSIHEVTCDRVLGSPPPGGPHRQVWLPVPGTGRLRQVDDADPWTPEEQIDTPRQSFDGWIVEVDVGASPPAGAAG